jgi:putative colanic acid biosynthesis UDP-glucose lipid carrier transferase
MLKEHLKFESLVPNYNFRDNVKPGITGLSQIAGLEGPANTIMKMNSRVTTDNIYIRNWSLKLDLMIILRTIYKLSGAR